MSPQQVPLLKPALAAMLGVVSAVLLPQYSLLFFLSLLAVCYLSLALLRSYIFLYARGLLWTFAAFLLFAALTKISFHGLYPPLSSLAKKTYLIEVNGIEQKGSKVKLYGNITSLEKFSGIVLNLKLDSGRVQDISPGSLIAAKILPRPITKPAFPQQFDYAKYMAFRSVYYQAYLRSTDYRVLSTQKSWTSYLEDLREEIVAKYQSIGIGEKELGVLAALTVGDKSELLDETKMAFTNSGTVHVLAVSGLHVGIIYIVLLTVFLQRRKKYLSWWTLILVMVLLWSYALLSGWSPSVRRATTMFSFLAFSAVLKRQGHPLNYLAASALLLMLLNPLVIFEVGFQMSYLAVMGILFLYPLIYHQIIFRNKLAKLLWQMICVSLAAQIATTPLSLYYFGQFPSHFLLANLVVIPLVTLIVWGGVLLNLLMFLFQDLAGYFAYIIDGLCSAVIFCTESISQLPHAVIKSIHLSLGQALILYLLLVAHLINIFNKHQALRAVVLASLLLLFVIPGPYLEEQGKIMYSTFNKTALVNCEDRLVFLSGGYAPEQAKSHLSVLQPKFAEYNYGEMSSISNQMLSTGQSPILNLRYPEKLEKQLVRTGVFILNEPVWDIGCINELKPKALVLSGSCKKGYAFWLKKKGLDIDIELHFPNEIGGLVFD